MQQRRDEILAKKAKLAELKRQRELRASQAASVARPSIPGGPSDVGSSRSLYFYLFLLTRIIAHLPHSGSRQSQGHRVLD